MLVTDAITALPPVNVSLGAEATNFFHAHTIKNPGCIQLNTIVGRN
jgi:hypothetical protein